MKKINTPNILTITRMLITPIFFAFFLIEAIPFHYTISLIIFVAGALTDLFDGKIARRKDTVTNFGKFADPLADKMLTTSAILGFISIGFCNVWIFFIIMFREFAVSSLRLVAASENIVIPANMWGKVKTTIQMVASIVIMLLLAVRFDFGVEAFAAETILIVANVLLWLMAAATVVSGTVYIVQGSKMIDFFE